MSLSMFFWYFLISLLKHWISLHRTSIIKRKQHTTLLRNCICYSHGPGQQNSEYVKMNHSPSKASDQEESDSNMGRETDVQPGGGIR